MHRRTQFSDEVSACCQSRLLQIHLKAALGDLFDKTGNRIRNFHTFLRTQTHTNFILKTNVTSHKTGWCCWMPHTLYKHIISCKTDLIYCKFNFKQAPLEGAENWRKEKPVGKPKFLLFSTRINLTASWAKKAGNRKKTFYLCTSLWMKLLGLTVHTQSDLVTSREVLTGYCYKLLKE